MSQGIPSHIINGLRRALVESEIFASDQSVRNFFNRTSLKPWKNSLPGGESPMERVDNLISFLHDKHRASGVTSEWYDGQNVLVIFIVELAQYYRQGQSEKPEPVELTPIFEALYQEFPALPAGGE